MGTYQVSLKVINIKTGGYYIAHRVIKAADGGDAIKAAMAVVALQDGECFEYLPIGPSGIPLVTTEVIRWGER